MGYLTASVQLIQYAIKGRKWDYMTIHRPSLARLPSSVTIPLLAGHMKKNPACPPEMQIILIHNYDKTSLAEKSLNYLGINNYVVLRPETHGPWRHSIKLVTLKKFLESKQNRGEYILYLDSADVVLRVAPQAILTYFQEQNCDLLFSRTAFDVGYECMEEVKEWSRDAALKSGCSVPHLNAGVFIGKSDFLWEVIDNSLKYITDNDLTPAELSDLIRQGQLCGRLPDFPKGIGDDQVILRYLYPQFYPRMKIDYHGKLSLRSTVSLFGKWFL
ncbi:MAG: glycosyltransferase domain-containing protein [Desulfosalsimonadaceae bacterium]